MNDSNIKIIKQISSDLLKKLHLSATIVVEKNQEQEGYKLIINSEESGLLIGYHGENLNSFQLILNALVYKKTASHQKIIVDVNNYRQKREETLKNLAFKYAEQVVNTKQEIKLPYFSPGERRTIHLALKDHPQVTSESTGEGKERRLVVKLKN